MVKKRHHTDFYYIKLNIHVDYSLIEFLFA